MRRNKTISQKEVSRRMISNACIEVHTSSVDRPSVPAWFAEVVMISQHLATNGLLDAFAHQIRLVRGRFGRYEPIDFLALLLGYAISGERTLADFFERLEPFEAAFMALFGRGRLPHRSSLSRFLSDVDGPCLEVFRSLFEQHSFANGWTSETIGGIFDRQGRRYIVFDVDATRQAARQRALPCASELPPPRRRLDAVCAPGYTGRKRGEVVRTRTTALQMHTRQWVGSYSGKGNGDYRGELASALRAITTYLKLFALTPEVGLVRLDGQYGDAVAMAHLMKAGVYFVTRARGYQVLEHPQIQGVLAHPPTAYVTRVSSNEVVELFDGGWLQVDEGLSPTRVIVARHRAPEPGKPIAVGKRVGEWVYELFITTLAASGFLVEDVLDVYHGRGAGDRRPGGRRYRRGSRSLVFLYRVRTRTLANRVSMGVESAASTWTADASCYIARNRVGSRQRSPSCVRGGGKRTARVRSVAVGQTVRSCHGTLRGGDLFSASKWDAALPCRSKPVAERSASRKCLYATGRLRRLPGGLSAL
jgi:hypothetical protein